MVASPESLAGEPPGILYYDPNPTTAKLASAGLRLAGYRVFAAEEKLEAISLCKTHGPAGDGSIAAILLDAAADPRASEELLKALVQLPGTADLPGILLVSRKNPTPIPAAAGLPTLKRPFSTPALVKIVRETLEDRRPIGPRGVATTDVTPLSERIRTVLEQHGAAVTSEIVASLATALATDLHLPVPEAGVTLHADLAITPLEAILEMLGDDGITGIVAVQRDSAMARLHLDRGRIRLAEALGTDEDLKLGRFVVEAGFMRDEELEAFVVGRDPEGRPLGTRLVDAGCLTTAELAQVLVNQAREVTCQLLTWRTGRLSFTPCKELDPLAAAAARDGKAELLVAEALLDGLRRLDDVAAMGPHIAAVDDVFLRIDEQVGRVGRHALARDELGVLELLNGRNSIKDIARKTRTGTFAVAQVLYRLGKAGLARRRVTPVTV